MPFAGMVIRAENGSPCIPSACCVYSPAVADHPRIDPVIVDVAVDFLFPVTVYRKAEFIVEMGRLVQARHYDHIMPFARHPAVKSQYTVIIMYMKDIDPAAPVSLLNGCELQ